MMKGGCFEHSVEEALAIEQFLMALAHSLPHGQVWIVSAHSVVEFPRDRFAFIFDRPPTA